jgi:hypothetical protein
MANVTTGNFGVKETKEALIAINETGLMMAKLFADGVQFDDFLSIWKRLSEDQAFKDQLVAAYQGWSNVSGEVADMDIQEALDLVSMQLSYIPKFVEALANKTPVTPAPSAAAKAKAKAQPAKK